MAENDENADEGNNESAPKDLRKQLSKAHKENDELRGQMQKLLARDRERTVGDLLSAKGLPSKVASLLPANVEADEASIDAWLTEYQDVFGSPKADEGDGGDGDDGIDAETKAAHERVATATAGATSSGRVADLATRIANAESPDALAEILATSGT